MKNADLYDYVVFQNNTQLAYDALVIWMNQPEFLILMFHVGMKWACIKKSQDKIISEFFPARIAPDLFYNVSN